MLSGGGRQVLASYTAFSYQGNFSDVACRLMDILPHQSPAVGVSVSSSSALAAAGSSPQKIPPVIFEQQQLQYSQQWLNTFITAFRSLSAYNATGDAGSGRQVVVCFQGISVCETRET